MLWVNRQLDGKVTATDRGLAYGDGVFATMRYTQAGPLLFELHLARLQQSCQRLGIDWQADDQFRTFLNTICRDAFQQNGLDGCVKVLLSRGSGGRGYQAPAVANITEVVSLHAIPLHYADWQAQGINLGLSNIALARQPRLAGMKHLNRLEQVLIREQTLAANCDDVVVCDSEGWVIETAVANLFMAKAGRVYTPRLAFAGVAGVMRQQLLIELAQLGWSVSICDINLAMLMQADNVFMTNSLFGIVDINSVNQQVFVHAPFTQTLRSALNLSL
ncbi:aminodeoxychorismate lyase [Shewanella waksmanii]|uniref:aminodeoxychorismate lyase n=1 Tax=Shewanella waksmanii TaxID=213783 RepID=UPI0004B517C4|nr:aminodeoxychorismate lyase [Shewanella waksmanii]